MKKHLAPVIMVSLLMASAAQADRTVHYAGIAQSKITRDQYGSGQVSLTCNVHLRNVSGQSQEVTAFTMSLYTAVDDPSVAGENLYAQVGPRATELRYFQYDSRSGTNNVTGATTAPPYTLVAYGTGADTLHLRGIASFAYRGNHDMGQPVPAGQTPMFYCTGQVRVREPAGVTSTGAVIASGVLETVANSFQNPSIQYGSSGFLFTGGAGTIAPNYSQTVVHQVWAGQFNTNASPRCSWGAPCVTPPSFSNTYPVPYPVTQCLDAFVPCDYPAAVAGMTPEAEWRRNACTTIVEYDLGGAVRPPDWGTAAPRGRTPPLAAFPQQIHSVPFQINGGRPF